jgi:hypothetical protein
MRSRVPDGGLIAGQTGRPTVGRKMILTLCVSYYRWREGTRIEEEESPLMNIATKQRQRTVGVCVCVICACVLKSEL